MMIKMQDGGRRIEFRKMSISPDWMKIFPPNSHHGHTEMIVGTLVTLSTCEGLSLHVLDRLAMSTTCHFTLASGY